MHDISGLDTRRSYILRTFAAELADHYGLPVPVAEVICLLVAAAAVGPAAQIRLDSTGPPVAANLMLAVATADQTEWCQVVDAVVAPVRQIQRELVRKYAPTVVLTQAQHAEFLAQLAELEATPFADPQHLASLRNQASTLRQRIAYQIMAEDPRPGTLVSVVGQSHDHGLLLLSGDSWLDRVTDRCISQAVQADLELLQCAWWNRPYFGAGGAGGAPMPSPAVSALIQGSPAAIYRFLHRPGIREFTILDCMMVASVTVGKPGNLCQAASELWRVFSSF